MTKVSGLDLISRSTERAQRNLIILAVGVFLANTLDVPLRDIELLEVRATPGFWTVFKAMLLIFAGVNYLIFWWADLTLYRRWFRANAVSSSFWDGTVGSHPPLEELNRALEMLRRRETRSSTGEIKEEVIERLARLGDLKGDWSAVDRSTKAIIFGWYFAIPVISFVVAALSFFFGFGMSGFRIPVS